MLRRHTRALSVAAAIGMAAIMLPVLAGVVFGHHTNMAAQLDCNGKVDWQLTNWTNNNSGGQATNRYMLVESSVDNGSTWTTRWTGTIAAVNYATPITGTFNIGTAASVRVRSRATGNWDNGNNSWGPWQTVPITTTVSGCTPAVATQIHDSAHLVVTSVPLGTTVHDSATVTGTSGITPTGTVKFRWYTQENCGGSYDESSSFTLVNGSVDGTTFTKTPLAPGSYGFKAVYSGDSRYSSKTGSCEPLTVTKADSSTATQIHNAAHSVVTSVAVGTVVHDKATVTGVAGGPTPGGNVTFKWFTNSACTGSPAATSGTFSLSGGSVDGTTFTQTPTPAGGYAFQAVYAGDSKYNGSTGACEPLTATKLGSGTSTQIHNAAHAVITSAVIGTTVHDSATVTGSYVTPTGTVDFTVYPAATCVGIAGSPAGTVALVAGVAHPSNTALVGFSGLAYKAHYNGDGNYNPSDGDCELLTAIKLGSTTTTDVHDANHGVILSAPIGSTVHDSATVTGSGPVPTGTVDFTVYPAATCVGVAGTPAGTVTLDALGVADPSNTALVTASGLAFKAHYNGDSTYNASDGACEPLTAIQLDSSTVTAIHDAGHAVVTSVPVGSTVHDNATVSGSYVTPTGTVTFSWFTNALCTGTPAATSGAIALSGGSVDATGFAQTPSPAGGYAFQATYSGDVNYVGSTGACEPLEVTRIDSNTSTTIHDGLHTVITSALIGTTVHDSATVTGSGPTPTGTVDFTLYSGMQCSGTGTPAGTVPLVSGIADPSNSTVVAPGGLSYIAHYNGDGIYNPSDGTCEPLEAIKLDSRTRTDIHDGLHTVITSALIGTTVHDSATVSGSYGTPTGTVDFTVYSNMACDGTGTPAGTVALVGGVADPSGTAVVGSAGLSFQGHYNGSATYDPSDGVCEPLEAIRLESSTATTIHDALHNPITTSPVGAPVHDTATVTGSYVTPTGTVTFRWYTQVACDSQYTQSLPFTLVNGFVDGDTFAQTPLAAGGYGFRAIYSGDANYAGSTGECEPLEVTQLQSSTVTEIHDAAHVVITSAPIGSTVHDSATVSGTGPVPTGTVDFTVYVNLTCDGNGFAAGSVSLVAGVAHPSADEIVPVGGLSFKAHYNGDATYVPSDGACEPLTASQLESSTVTEIHDAAHAVVTNVLIGTPVHDSATVSGSGPTPTGTVTFSWFTNSACDGQPAATSGAFALSGGTVDATGFVQVPPVSGGYGFQAVYSGDATYAGSTGACEPLTAHDPQPTPTPTATPTTPPTLPPTFIPTEPPFPSFPSEPPTPTPTPTPTETALPTQTVAPTGSVEAVTSKPNITPPPTNTSGSGGSTGGFGLAAVLVLLVSAGAILLATPKRRSTRR